jgi:hypothetical protein
MWAKRPGEGGFAFQGFNYPKSAWGGQLRSRMRRLEGTDLVRKYEEIGGSTTPSRRHWRRGLRDARSGGWYRTMSGTITDMRLADRDGDGVVASVSVPDGSLDVAADYVIDCTGLDGDVAEHRVLGDLLRFSGAGRNPLGRLDVGRDFELRGTDNGSGRIYVTGAAAYGGYFPGVDTFLGLQLAAQDVIDDIARRGHCVHMGPARSIAAWLRWVANRQI